MIIILAGVLIELGLIVSALWCIAEILKKKQDYIRIRQYVSTGIGIIPAINLHYSLKDRGM